MKIRIAKDLSHREAKALLQCLPDSASMIKQQQTDGRYPDQYSVALPLQGIDYVPNSASFFGIGPAEHCDAIEDVYLTVTVSMQFLSDDDCALLDSLAHEDGSATEDAGMVMKCNTGFIMKLHTDTDDLTLNLRDGYSEALKHIVGWAGREGFTAIEFNAVRPVG